MQINAVETDAVSADDKMCHLKGGAVEREARKWSEVEGGSGRGRKPENPFANDERRGWAGGPAATFPCSWLHRLRVSAGIRGAQHIRHTLVGIN